MNRPLNAGARSIQWRWRSVFAFFFFSSCSKMKKYCVRTFSARWSMRFQFNKHSPKRRGKVPHFVLFARWLRILCALRWKSPITRTLKQLFSIAFINFVLSAASLSILWKRKTWFRALLQHWRLCFSLYACQREKKLLIKTIIGSVFGRPENVACALQKLSRNN